jgi:hypothetical protein
MALEAEKVLKATSRTTPNRSLNPLHRLRGRDLRCHIIMSTRIKRRPRSVGAGVYAVMVVFTRQVEVWEEEQ